MTEKFSQLIFSFIWFVFFSCQKKMEIIELKDFKKVKSFSKESFKKSRNLSAFDSIKVLQCNDLVVNTKFIIILTQKPAITLIDRHAKIEAGYGGTYGEGPGEHIDFTTESEIDASNNFWVSDVTLRRATQYNIDSLILNKKYIPKNQVQIESKYYSSEPVFFLNNFVAYDFNGENRLLFFNKNGEFIRSGGIMPKSSNLNMPKSIIAMAFQGLLNTNNNDRIVKINIGWPLVEIYNNEGREVKTLWGPDNFKLNYKVVNQNGFSVLDADPYNRTEAYYDSYITKNKIYLLYCGMKSSNYNYCNTIYVFDLNGNEIEILNTDFGIRQIYVDDVNNELIAFSDAKGLLFYKL